MVVSADEEPQHAGAEGLERLLLLHKAAKTGGSPDRRARPELGIVA